MASYEKPVTTSDYKWSCLFSDEWCWGRRCHSLPWLWSSNLAKKGDDIFVSLIVSELVWRPALLFPLYCLFILYYCYPQAISVYFIVKLFFNKIRNSHDLTKTAEQTQKRFYIYIFFKANSSPELFWCPWLFTLPWAVSHFYSKYF